MPTASMPAAPISTGSAHATAPALPATIAMQPGGLAQDDAASPLPVTRDRAALEAVIDSACRKIAPLWPLKHFVAVNPFLGFTGQTFARTCATMKRVAGADMLMPRAFYREALAAGVIDDAALDEALAAAGPGAPADVPALKAALAREPGPREVPAVVATVAEVLDTLAEGDREASLVGFMIDEISRFCAAYWDEGQASWKSPVRLHRPWAAWRMLARHDRNPETMGIAGFRRSIMALPDDPVEVIAQVVERLGIPDRAIEDYLHRSLFDIGGWAAYARYLVWNAELHGGSDDSLVQLLAIRIAWGYALFEARPDPAVRTAWAAAMARAADLPQDGFLAADPELTIDLLAQEAYEIAFRRGLVGRISDHATARSTLPLPARKPVQAAFCIDVRSEVFRRAFETACPQAETIGFAGFFGFPIEYVPIGQMRGGAQCPVLLTPKFIVCEEVGGAGEEQETEVLGLRLMRRRATKAWKAFKLSAVSSFSYVETAGLAFAGKIVSDSAGLTRTVAHPQIEGLDADIARKLGPRLSPRPVGGRATGFTVEQRVAMAQAVLKAMSMTGDFARIVMLAGHGSTTVNNPHASGLDCGACGGHTGEANARVAAAILNDPQVREGLAQSGIIVPQDTWFLGALHDTTTDEVTIYAEHEVPASHGPDLERLKAWLARAGALARLERSALLGLGGGGVTAADAIDTAVTRRSRDWSQVRPEWGLAGNAAFIAAPRERTRGLDLGGRSFLHSYDHEQDNGYGVLELIMTAPMVVASWINLQYYGSTVNNRVFGCGNKVLHNVVGQLGVLEGNAGDLKVGLPWQSVHDGKRFVHEPLRLNVFIEAPEAAMDDVLARHDTVRDLVENGWVHLHALADKGRTIRRRFGAGDWRAR
jgi:uncharacterized protein YbcC (UPF0753/DUF2309 family)